MKFLVSSVAMNRQCEAVVCVFSLLGSLALLLQGSCNVLSPSVDDGSVVCVQVCVSPHFAHGSGARVYSIRIHGSTS